MEESQLAGKVLGQNGSLWSHRVPKGDCSFRSSRGILRKSGEERYFHKLLCRFILCECTPLPVPLLKRLTMSLFAQVFSRQRVGHISDLLPVGRGSIGCSERTFPYA